jgi:hypothetical protein
MRNGKIYTIDLNRSPCTLKGIKVCRRMNGLSQLSWIFPYILRQAQDERKNP